MIGKKQIFLLEGNVNDTNELIPLLRAHQRGELSGETKDLVISKLLEIALKTGAIRPQDVADCLPQSNGGPKLKIQAARR